MPATAPLEAPMATPDTATDTAPEAELAEDATNEDGEGTRVEELPEPAPARSPADLARAYAPAGALAAAAGAVALVVAARVLARRPDEDEHVLYSGRPRKVLWRYASTLGLWELARRATRFTVTDRFIVVDQGVLRRSSRSMPISAVRDVSVASGPWQGYVELRGPGGSEVLGRRLGPLRAPEARALARVIGREIPR
jgi:hypothetical protein